MTREHRVRRAGLAHPTESLVGFTGPSKRLVELANHAEKWTPPWTDLASDSS